MYVTSWEEGDRPSVMTRARHQAPAARSAIVDMLVSQDFASMGYVVIDWTGRIAFVDGDGRSQDGPALDRQKPVMYIQVIKSMPQYRGSIVAEHRVDIDDVFGGTSITGADLAGLVLSLKEEVAEQEARAHKEARN
jgi:hypothetical protein